MLLYNSGMKRSLVLVLAAALLTPGCADGGCDLSKPSPEPSAIAGKERPIKIQPGRFAGLSGDEINAAVPVPGGHPSYTEQVLVGLRHKTLAMAGAIGETDAGRCDEDVVGRVGFTTRCTVTYEGVEVPWVVEITGTEQAVMPGGLDYTYTSQPLASVHTARSVYEGFAFQLAGMRDKYEGRCDQIPALFTAKPGQDTEYRCQLINAFCENDGYGFEWVDRRVHIDEKGGVTFAGV
ncbi:hypothetical protein [Planotetraspora kaengkrachanensis]|uniref:Lipoprotein n=1 Tax=Planotetraspora kaengkrachanensis TaxID=575193 RepID=A0A8J3PZZ3_9ACTN|nr:hypothetical protein [Planotetraspora kaengkrachanensis]GIG84212.1 hypothetical protein Pka01_73390 [Planotetraspora kaengkrachanensis]